MLTLDVLLQRYSFLVLPIWTFVFFFWTFVFFLVLKQQKNYKNGS